MRLRIAARVIAYFGLAWGTLIALASGLFAGSGLVALAVAVYFTAPLIAFIRWRGWPFYPKAGFRLFVVRPFWYAQLLLPLVATGGALGLLGGLPFGHALNAGRIAAGVVFVAMAIVRVAGYLGSRSLVVRQVDVEVPGIPAAFDGLRI